MKTCTKCNLPKPLTEYYANKRSKDGKRYSCKACDNAHLKAYREDPTSGHREVRRTWAKAHADKLREQDRMLRELHPDMKRVNEARRRARKKALPDTLTIEQTEELLTFYDGKCAICEADAEHLDHFMPLASGCGGTMIENIIPLCQPMNTSKKDRNPFEWRKTLSESEQERFDAAVVRLAGLNAMTPQEYEDYVIHCF